jgi:hypothetical protein
MKFSLPLLAILFTSLLFGCGAKDGYAELGLVPVTGTVTLDGQPLSGAKVVFESDDKRTSTGTTDSAGQYKLMYDSQTPGALPGPKAVRITTADVDVEGGGAAEGAATVKEILPARYNTKSELKAEVSTDKKTHDFPLTSTP